METTEHFKPSTVQDHTWDGGIKYNILTDTRNSLTLLVCLVLNGGCRRNM